MEKMADVEEVLLHLANKCIRLSGEERPELTWLKAFYEQFRNRCMPSGKLEADRLLFEKMYSRMPQKPSDTLKIRYWRTGRHTPVNREQCLMFGKAMEMNDKDLDFLIKKLLRQKRQNFLKKVRKIQYILKGRDRWRCWHWNI